MSFLTPPRVDTEELLDEHDVPYEDMARSLRDLRRINRYLGGISVHRRLLKKFRGDARSLESVLDVGTGTSDLPASLPGNELRRYAVDVKIEHLLYGRSHYPSHIHRIVADAFRLPFRAESIDVVCSGHFFHHFSPEENQQLLTEALTVGRMGVVVNDTRRHYVPLALIHLLGALRLVGRITRFDGPASVRRGYTTQEVRSLGRLLPARRMEVRRIFPFRFGLLLWK